MYFLITRPYPNLNLVLAKPLVMLGHGWMITYQDMQMQLRIHVVNSICVAYEGK